jgi:hypothetical protein
MCAGGKRGALNFLVPAPALPLWPSAVDHVFEEHRQRQYPPFRDKHLSQYPALLEMGQIDIAVIAQMPGRSWITQEIVGATG